MMTTKSMGIIDGCVGVSNRWMQCEITGGGGREGGWVIPHSSESLYAT